MANHILSHALIIFQILITFAFVQSQTQPFPNATCNTIFLSYQYTGGYPVPPFIPSDPTHQPYRFQSVLFVQNNGLEELKNWRVRVGFAHNEYLVSAPKAVLADGTSLPADVSNGTVFAGEASPDLKTAAQTAGNYEQMQARIELVGTQYGVAAPNVPMPSTFSLANDAYACPAPTLIGNNELQVCCNIDPDYKESPSLPTEYSSLQNGDLTITYDITKTYDTYYWAQVMIINHSPLSRLDNWHLSWDWTRGEFIHSMRGAYPTIIDSTDCIYGPQGQYYKGLDFSTILNCDRRPSIKDLPISKKDDTNVGLVPHCCRDGVILPPRMDVDKSKSAFTMQVYKMPPNLNRTELYPPQSFRINGTFNPDYQCGPPIRVSPTLYNDSTGLDSQWSAVASWQVACNITVARVEKPKCCVTFSAFYNDSIIPCNTCACGCQNQPMNTCSATSSPLFLPYDALVVPFDNRTDMVLSHYIKEERWPLPTNPLPCGDNCGVSINWHLLTDFTGEWTVRMSVFNWGETNFVDWFAAVELEKSGPGFEKAYSFNGTIISESKNSTIVFQGLPGMNYLLAERQSDNPRKKPPVPGMIQSEIRFTKKNIQGINVANGDGFPTKLLFNGEECSLPLILPTSNANNKMASFLSSFFLLTLTLLL